MNKRLSFVASVFLASFALGIAGAGIAYAHDDDDSDSDSGEFRWLAATGLTVFGDLCVGGPPCPAAALESGMNGDLIEIVGEGTLENDDGDRDVTGGGSWRILKHPYNTPADVLDVGTFTATKLKSFESFGGDKFFPSTWRLGRALIRIRMVSDLNGEKTKATLLVGCILPDPIDPDGVPGDLIEGIRLKVKGGGNFNTAPPGSPQRSTLFIQLDDDD